MQVRNLLNMFRALLKNRQSLLQLPLSFVWQLLSQQVQAVFFSLFLFIINEYLLLPVYKAIPRALISPLCVLPALVSIFSIAIPLAVLSENEYRNRQDKIYCIVTSLFLVLSNLLVLSEYVGIIKKLL